MGPKMIRSILLQSRGPIWHPYGYFLSLGNLVTAPFVVVEISQFMESRKGIWARSFMATTRTRALCMDRNLVYVSKQLEYVKFLHQSFNILEVFLILRYCIMKNELFDVSCDVWIDPLWSTFWYKEMSWGAVMGLLLNTCSCNSAFKFLIKSIISSSN